jgi:hypothetical protein
MNTSGNAYGLTVLSPIKNGSYNDVSHATLTRNRLQNLPLHTKSPMAKVPNTYLCRFYVLDDVFYQGKPAIEEHLKSKYIVFSSNFHGDRDEYLTQMWLTAEQEVRHIWQFCYGFDEVNDAAAFVEYIKKCQVKTTLFFNGSTDDSLAEQLKGLYLKQELSKFVFENQSVPAEALQKNFKEFIQRTEPKNLAGPTWVPGAATLEDLEGDDPSVKEKPVTKVSKTERDLEPA